MFAKIKNVFRIFIYRIRNVAFLVLSFLGLYQTNKETSQIQTSIIKPQKEVKTPKDKILLTELADNPKDGHQRQTYTPKRQIYNLKANNIGLEIYDEDGKIVIYYVANGSKGAFAKLEAGNILTKFNGQKLTNSIELIQLVNQALDSELTFEYINNQGQKKVAVLAPNLPIKTIVAKDPVISETAKTPSKPATLLANFEETLMPKKVSISAKSDFIKSKKNVIIPLIGPAILLRPTKKITIKPTQNKITQSKLQNVKKASLKVEENVQMPKENLLLAQKEKERPKTLEERKKEEAVMLSELVMQEAKDKIMQAQKATNPQKFILERLSDNYHSKFSFLKFTLFRYRIVSNLFSMITLNHNLIASLNILNKKSRYQHISPYIFLSKKLTINKTEQLILDNLAALASLKAAINIFFSPQPGSLYFEIVDKIDDIEADLQIRLEKMMMKKEAKIKKKLPFSKAIQNKKANRNKDNSL